MPIPPPILPRPRPHPITRIFSPGLLLAGLVFLAPTAARAQALPGDHSTPPVAKPVFEQWAVLVLAGHPCGYGSVITTQEPNSNPPRYRTESDTVFVVKREGTRLKMDDASTVVEDADGGVVSFSQTLNEGGSKVEVHGVRAGDDLVVTSRGQTERYHVPRLAALGPEAIQRLSDAIPLQAGKTFSFNTFSPDEPQTPVVEAGTIVGQENHDVRGKTMKLWKLTVTNTGLPGVPTLTWVDDQSNEVETVETLPGIGEMHEYTTDRSECMQQPEGAEVFANSLVSPDKAMPNPDDLYQATYKIMTTDLNTKMSLWNQGEQRVISSEPGATVVAVTAIPFHAADAGYSLPAPDTAQTHPYLVASAYLESDNPDIKKLAQEAVGPEKNPVEAAHKIEQFVAGYIVKKDLNVIFGSAEDTAKSREGDCTEHAVLCAAIGRAAGLPTRCVVGLGYIPPGEAAPTIANAVDNHTGLFGFHMWAEALVAPDRWMPMDAALGSFDVGHIAIFKTPLDGINPMTDSESVATLIADLHISVLSTVTKEQARAEAIRLAAAKAAATPHAEVSAPIRPGAVGSPAMARPSHAPSAGKSHDTGPEGVD
jgi:hypothetical protein